MKLKLIEPLKEFLKDEVRILGKSLGFLKVFFKTSFSRPGLGIKNYRKYYTEERIKILQEADIYL